MWEPRTLQEGMSFVERKRTKRKGKRKLQRGQRREILKKLLFCKACVLFELCWVYVLLISKVNCIHKNKIVRIIK